MKKVKYVVLAIALFLTCGYNVKAASKTINDGVYTIYSAINQNYTLDVAGGKIDNKTNIQLYKSNNTAAQQWKVEYLNDGYYKITSVKDNDYSLDVTGGKKKKGTNIQLYKYTGAKAQQWIIKDAGSGYYYIISKCNNLAIDVKGGKAANNKNIQVWTQNKSKAQKFIFAPVVTGSKTIEDGNYYIKTSLNNSSAIDIKGGKIANNTNIQIYKSNNSLAQQWKVEYLNNGYYKITSVKDNNYSLDVKGAAKLRGTNIQLYKSNNSLAQQWVIEEAGSGYYTIVSRVNGLALDVAGGKTANSTNVQTYTSNGTKAQKFKLEKIVSLKTPKIDSYEGGWSTSLTHYIIYDLNYEVGGCSGESCEEQPQSVEKDYDKTELYLSTNGKDYKLVGTFDKEDETSVSVDLGIKAYVKTRNYKTINGTKYYSNYSNVLELENYYFMDVSGSVNYDNDIEKDDGYNFDINNYYDREDEKIPDKLDIYVYYLSYDNVDEEEYPDYKDFTLVKSYDATNEVQPSYASYFTRKAGYYYFRSEITINGKKYYSRNSEILETNYLTHNFAVSYYAVDGASEGKEKFTIVASQSFGNDGMDISRYNEDGELEVLATTTNSDLSVTIELDTDTTHELVATLFAVDEHGERIYNDFPEQYSFSINLINPHTYIPEESKSIYYDEEKESNVVTFTIEVDGSWEKVDRLEWSKEVEVESYSTYYKDLTGSNEATLYRTYEYDNAEFNEYYDFRSWLISDMILDATSENIYELWIEINYKDGSKVKLPSTTLDTRSPIATKIKSVDTSNEDYDELTLVVTGNNMSEEDITVVGYYLDGMIDDEDEFDIDQFDANDHWMFHIVGYDISKEDNKITVKVQVDKGVKIALAAAYSTHGNESFYSKAAYYEN